MDLWAYNKTASSNTVDFPENMSPGAVNDEARELQAMFARYRDDQGGTISTGGTSTAFTASLNTTPASLVDGFHFRARAGTTNAAGPVTLVVTPSGASALASKKIKKYNSATESDLVAADIVAGNIYEYIYKAAGDSATGAWMLTNPSLAPAKSLAADGYVKLPSGLILQWGDVTFSAASSSAVTFPVAFTTVYNVQVTSNSTANPMAGVSLANSGFTASTASSFSGTVYWTAIGV